MHDFLRCASGFPSSQLLAATTTSRWINIFVAHNNVLVGSDDVGTPNITFKRLYFAFFFLLIWLLLPCWLLPPSPPLVVSLVCLHTKRRHFISGTNSTLSSPAEQQWARLHYFAISSGNAVLNQTKSTQIIRIINSHHSALNFDCCRYGRIISVVILEIVKKKLKEKEQSHWLDWEGTCCNRSA